MCFSCPCLLVSACLTSLLLAVFVSRHQPTVGVDGLAIWRARHLCVCLLCRRGPPPAADPRRHLLAARLFRIRLRPPPVPPPAARVDARQPRPAGVGVARGAGRHRCPLLRSHCGHPHLRHCHRAAPLVGRRGGQGRPAAGGGLRGGWGGLRPTAGGGGSGGGGGVGQAVVALRFAVSAFAWIGRAKRRHSIPSMVVVPVARAEAPAASVVAPCGRGRGTCGARVLAAWRVSAPCN